MSSSRTHAVLLALSFFVIISGTSLPLMIHSTYTLLKKITRTVGYTATSSFKPGSKSALSILRILTTLGLVFLVQLSFTLTYRHAETSVTVWRTYGRTPLTKYPREHSSAVELEGRRNKTRHQAGTPRCVRSCLLPPLGAITSQWSEVPSRLNGLLNWPNLNTVHPSYFQMLPRRMPSRQTLISPAMRTSCPGCGTTCTL